MVLRLFEPFTYRTSRRTKTDSMEICLYAVLETTKYLTTVLNKRCTIWISPTLYGLLYSAVAVLSTLLLQAGTGFQLLMLYVVACPIQMVLLTKPTKSSRPIMLID